MNNSLAWLMVGIPALPLAAAVLTPILGPKILKERSHWIAIVAIGSAFLLSLLLLMEVLRAASGDARFASSHGFERLLPLWKWASISDAMKTATGSAAFDIEIVLRADGLTALMLCMVTFVALLVAIFSTGYMHGEPGYWRFFTYLSLFVFSMTMLVSVSNFLLLFVFWEAVGACSYLLIGFWYTKPEAVAAGKKAFLVNRVGDFGLALAIFLIWSNYGTLNFHDAPINSEQLVSLQSGAGASTAAEANGILGQDRLANDGYIKGPQGTRDYTIALSICLLLLLGCCGKSAQFPLHVWLPDAMEGPTPASALIHAATMVTAGVYLIARCTPLFVASPDAQLVVACIGGFTAFIAGVIALTQTDLKRVLAYSTVSQLGYMFLGLGAGTETGVTAGMFHLFTHAFFKALLFLGAGSVMHAMHHVIDMRRFSGLKEIMPITRWTFLIGCLALAGVFPFAGFWSKDEILASVAERQDSIQHELSDRESGHAAKPTRIPAEILANLASDESPPHGLIKNLNGNQSVEQLQRAQRIYGILFWLALATAFMTAFYTFRAYFLTFHGELRTPEEAGDHAHEVPANMWAPLVVLAVCSVVAGFMFNVPIFLHSTGEVGKAAGLSLHQVMHWTPQLAEGNLQFVAGHGHADHLFVAGISTVAAISGVLLAMFLYLGDRKEVDFLYGIMNGEALANASDVTSLTNSSRRGPISVVYQFMCRIGLGGVARFLGNAVLILALLLSAPLLLFRFASPYRLSQNKLYFDEAYDWAIVRPLRGLASLAYLFDRYFIDMSVNLAGRIPSIFGGLMRSMQMGLVQFYALAMILGAVALLAARLIWNVDGN
jgi:NADH-quinone oxidoreductase subunit L